MSERLLDKPDRLGAEAEIPARTPEIRRFALLVRSDMLKQWEQEVRRLHMEIKEEQ